MCTARFNQTRMPVILTMISVVLLFVTAARSADVEPATASKEPLIQATGTARVLRAPDYVDVCVGIEANASSAAEAQASANHVMEATSTAIRTLKLKDEELKTSGVDLSPRYERRNIEGYMETGKIIGYSAKASLRVRTADLKTVASIIDASLKAGCNRVDSVEFGIKEALAAREEALKLATRAAKRKAEVTAEALDLKLVRVSVANTSSTEPWLQANQLNISVSSRGSAEQGEPSVVIPGMVEITAAAEISFVAAAAK